MSTPNAIPQAAEALPDPADADNIVYNPSDEQLREFSAHLETTTEFGSPAYVSEQRSRSSDRTKNDIDDEFEAADYDRIADALSYAREHELLCIDRQIGRHPDHTYYYRYYVPREYGRIALAITRLFEPAPADADPDFLTVQLPDHDDLAIRTVPDTGVTAVLGSDYTGEAKKAALRLFMYRSKQAGGLGLHAGSKRVTVRDDDDDLRTVGQVFLGLSGTGKSTLTAHGLGLDDPENAVMVQDDVCALFPDGTVAGSEGNGLFLKTIGLEHEEQPEVYEAVTHESAVLENVAVDDGTVDFDSDTYTSNGRATVLREHLDSAADEIDLERAQQVFFITRNPTMPPIVKLPTEAAAAAFMLGESVQTSAGDPSSAGEAIRVVGTNPFIIGSEGEEGNRFRDLVDDLGVECYVLNTGHLGDEAKQIGVAESTTILREISRGRVEWDDADDSRGFAVPTSVPGMDINEYDAADYVEEYDRKRRELREERRAYLAEFDDLDEDIIENVY